MKGDPGNSAHPMKSISAQAAELGERRASRERGIRGRTAVGVLAYSDMRRFSLGFCHIPQDKPKTGHFLTPLCSLAILVISMKGATHEHAAHPPLSLKGSREVLEEMRKPPVDTPERRMKWELADRMKPHVDRIMRPDLHARDSPRTTVDEGACNARLR